MTLRLCALCNAGGMFSRGMGRRGPQCCSRHWVHPFWAQSMRHCWGRCVSAVSNKEKYKLETFCQHLFVSPWYFLDCYAPRWSVVTPLARVTPTTFSGILHCSSNYIQTCLFLIYFYPFRQRQETRTKTSFKFRQHSLSTRAQGRSENTRPIGQAGLQDLIHLNTHT